MAEIIIIGGGVSGLSAGIYSQLNGHHATICERQKTIGGNLTGWQRGEYHIDNCIHWLTGTNPSTDTYKIWEELGALGNVEVYQGETLYTFEYKGKQLSLSKNLKTFEADMLACAPKDEREIKSFIKAVEIMQYMNGIGGQNHNEKYNIFQDILAVPVLAKYHRMTTKELSIRFKTPILRKFITAMLGDDFSALAYVIVVATFCGENGGIPKGSSCAMANRMKERFLHLGGTILLNKEVVDIEKTQERAYAVILENGTRLQADYVVITSEPSVAFKKLLKMKMPKSLDKQYEDSKMLRFSSYQCAFSCDMEKLPFEADFIFELPEKDQAALRIKNLILREFSHERGFAPSGKNIIQTLTFCSEKDCKEFIKLREDKAAYKKRKVEIADEIQRIIISKFPQMDGKISCIDVWTPATYQRYTDAEIGSFMSFVLPAKHRLRCLDNRVNKLKNVFLATQWLQAPGGLPIAAKVGKRAVENIMKTCRQQ